jgi:hypothetical protein
MKRALALVVVLAAFVVPVRADSVPVISGVVSGFEICEQASPCGSATFVALFQGRVGGNPNAIGIIAVAVNHETPLPDPDDCKAITGGHWVLTTLARQISGETTGMLCGNEGNTFTVVADLELKHGGFGHAFFGGTLDHNFFPPRIFGFITQLPQLP